MAIPNISEIRDGKRVITKKPELLLPAGNLEKLKNKKGLKFFYSKPFYKIVINKFYFYVQNLLLQ